MTLVELLVAFMVLLMLVGALVALTTRSLQTWSTGETRKEMYDRAQVVLDALVRDVRNTYVETEIYDDGRKELQVPMFASDLDRNKQPRLRFVRTGNPYVIGATAPAGRPRTIIPVMSYGEAWEVAYMMDPDPAKATLYRGVRFFDRQLSNNLLKPSNYEDPAQPLFAQCFKPVESGILYIGFKFWTQFTTTWDDTVPLMRTAAASRHASGPEVKWDSTRQDKLFWFHRRLDRANPDFVYPAIVQITVHVESGSPETTGVKLADPIDDRSPALRLTHTRGLPDAPGLVRIEGEWIEYGAKSLTELTELKRGRRRTAVTSHAALTPVRFGETFTTEVRLPAHREAQEP